LFTEINCGSLFDKNFDILALMYKIHFIAKAMININCNILILKYMQIRMKFGKGKAKNQIERRN